MPESPGASTTSAASPPLGLFSCWRADIPASVVVFLVALPLCLGVALASGAPLLSGVVAGVVGGVVVGFASGSQLMVSGPAAGLTAIVIAGIGQAGSFARFLPAVVLGGVLQIVLGAARAGVIGYYFPSSVIKGMLAAIGLTLILKQVPHAVGYDADWEGDMAFIDPSGENTFGAIGTALQQVQFGAIVTALLGVALMVLWPRTPLAKVKLFPAPLAAVVLGVGLNELLGLVAPDLAIRGTHLVALPTEGLDAVVAQLTRPEWSALTDQTTWMLAATIGIVASLESLLSLEATNKLDPEKRDAPANRELFAQGLGNVVSGLAGGLPVTGVIVRSSANIDAGARTRLSAVLHALLLVVAVLFLASILNRIPLAALAAVLLVTGFKLSSPALWKSAWRLGWSHFLPFAITIIAILFTDLLKGIAFGLVVGVMFILAEHMRRPVLVKVSPPGAILTRYLLPQQVTFLSKASLARTLEAIPPGSRVEIDGRQTTRFDYDALEVLLEFREAARSRNIDYRLVGVPDAALTPAH
ncbi:MAG: STAS domain-containing protein [Gemmatimonadetes bacterium]|nr:STAS domain-containing protein [Gemmatimonadota bacterium]